MLTAVAEAGVLFPPLKTYLNRGNHRTGQSSTETENWTRSIVQLLARREWLFHSISNQLVLISKQSQMKNIPKKFIEFS